MYRIWMTMSCLLVCLCVYCIVLLQQEQVLRFEYNVSPTSAELYIATSSIDERKRIN